jgi:hypothetical protein
MLLRKLNNKGKALGYLIGMVATALSEYYVSRYFDSDTKWFKVAFSAIVITPILGVLGGLLILNILISIYNRFAKNKIDITTGDKFIYGIAVGCIIKIIFGS